MKYSITLLHSNHSNQVLPMSAVDSCVQTMFCIFNVAILCPIREAWDSTNDLSFVIEVLKQEEVKGNTTLRYMMMMTLHSAKKRSQRRFASTNPNPEPINHEL